MIKTKPLVNLFWFRRDLRLFDNHGLFESLQTEFPVLPVFIFDQHILSKLSDKNDKRVTFIYQTLQQLNQQLVDAGSSLLILFDEPLLALQKITQQYQIQTVFSNHDYEPYAIDRDDQITSWLKENGIRFQSYKDQVIFEKSEVMKSDGTPYTVFTPYSKIWKQRLAENPIQHYPAESLQQNYFKTPPFKFPELRELGFELVEITFPAAQVNEKKILHYHLTRNDPALDGCSHLSIHLRFGTLSIRNLVKLAISLNGQWLNELIWREFFMMILFQFPKVVNHCFKSKYENISWRNDEREFQLWCEGKTGYPIVDAGMRELNASGFMHNRVRMIVASFLTKHLLIDWRWGEAYFAEKLNDFELSSNNGNWQWAAGCGCDAAPYFRIFNPSEQTKKFDKDYKYIQQWIENFHPAYLEPIVEHSFARNRALEVYKSALERK